MTVRVRFAPSPTGWIHVGNMRTVIFTYLFARHEKGTFVLRIEDTDQNRKIPSGDVGIFETLEFMGIKPDEGPGIGGDYGPYVQSERLPLYRKHAEELIEKGHAYYCFCSPERLSMLREQQRNEGKKTMYDRCCREIPLEEARTRVATGEKHVIRLKVPDNEKINIEDLVYGHLTFDSQEVDDQVLIKSDGYPTYHMAVVVDDHYMKITHITRGEDWFSSSPKLVLLYRFLGWTPPQLVHVPNVLNPDRIGKLSKRKGAVSVIDFLRHGYFRDALFNFLPLIGWNPDPSVARQDEFYSEEFLIKHFDINRIKKSSGAFDNQKLDAINALWMKHFSPDEIITQVKAWNSIVQRDLIIDEVLGKDEDLMLLRQKAKTLMTYNEQFPDKFRDLLGLVQPRAVKIVDLHDWLMFLFDDTFDKEQLLKLLNEEYSLLQKLRDRLMNTVDWNQEPWENAIRSLADEVGMKHADLFMILRIIVTGRRTSPPLRDVMVIVGREFVSRKFDIVQNVVAS